MAESAVVGGDNLRYKIAYQSVSSALRSLIIHLSNRTSCILINPQIYTFSGYCYVPPQPTVGKGVTEVCAFGHKKGTDCGSVGVLTYDITEDLKKEAVKRLAIMFSVPFDYASFENWFALGLFDTTQSCDRPLYELMYYHIEQNFKRACSSGSEVSFKDEKFKLRGTMSPVAKAEMKVELWDVY